MFKNLKSLFASERKPAPRKGEGIETVIAPEEEFFAIGDVHGCASLMGDKIARIRAVTGGKAPIVLVGDYIDRGSESAQVLTRLFEMQGESPDEIVCLKGNHEAMLLEFIDDPAGYGARWMKFGGRNTMESFGIGKLGKKLDFDDALEAANSLEEAMPEGLQAWLRALPMQWSSGNVHCVHAAMDPGTAPLEQTEETLLWGHDAFMRQSRSDGVCVVHGHTIVPRPLIWDGRISIDTGAYETGKLTAVHISPARAAFL